MRHDGPFLGTEALAAGLVTRYQLRTEYTALYRNVYVPIGQEVTPVTKAVGAWLWSSRKATVAGLSAAALHGSKWIDAGLPAELNRSSRDKVDDILLHSDELWDDEICTRAGISVTTPARTAFDIGRRKGLTLAVIRLDALMQATDVKTVEVETIAARHPGTRGIVQLRRVVKLADAGAESPQETRTRLLLVTAGLAPPSTQINVYNAAGQFVARVDMGWPQWRVAVEFDGAQHWTDPVQRTRDIDRLAELEALGWKIIRVSSDMLRYRPGVIVDRVRAALPR
ncbi:MAG TPA: DUF559 domain-containing protein [Mycobacterium sp.]|nr:DUF559 domain-containing protein [Mycobacterium sp.]